MAKNRNIPEAPDTGDSGGANDVEKTATQETIDEYKKGLSDRIKNAEVQAYISQTGYDSCADQKVGNETCYDHAVKGYDTYKGISIDPMAGLAKDAEEAYQLICDLKDTLKKDIDTKMTSSVTAIKELDKKIGKVKDAFCKLEKEIGDNCNSDQLDILKKEIEGGPRRILRSRRVDPVDSSLPAEPPTDFEKWIKLLDRNVKRAGLTSNALINKSVQIAGLNAMINMDNLKTVGGTMKGSLTKLDSNVKENVDYLDGQVKTICGELKGSEACLSEKTSDECENNLTVQAMYEICTFVDDPDSTYNWNTIRTKIDELICYTSPSSPNESSGSDDDYIPPEPPEPLGETE